MLASRDLSRSSVSLNLASRSSKGVAGSEICTKSWAFEVKCGQIAALNARAPMAQDRKNAERLCWLRRGEPLVADLLPAYPSRRTADANNSICSAIPDNRYNRNNHDSLRNRNNRYQIVSIFTESDQEINKVFGSGQDFGDPLCLSIKDYSRVIGTLQKVNAASPLGPLSSRVCFQSISFKYVIFLAVVGSESWRVSNPPEALPLFTFPFTPSR